MVLKTTLTSTPKRHLHRVLIGSGLALMCCCWTEPAQAVLLWSDLGTTLAHDSREGVDILGGAVRRDDTASDTLYFKFHVDPLSDVSTEEYFAAFQLYEGGNERLGLGNSLKAWAYSAFNTASTGEYNKVYGDVDLRSVRPEPASEPGVRLPYEVPRRGIENTIVFKVTYVPDGDDEITVWLNPDLRAAATQDEQPEEIIIHFTANASFDQIRLRHGGGGNGWSFSDMAIATSFSDFVAGLNSPAGQTGNENSPKESQRTLRSWQREQGLPQNAVRALAQTSDGYIWVGTDDGVTRFDGVRFVSFGLREGLRSGPVRALMADSGGALWLGTTGGGLSRMQDGKFVTWTTADGLPSDTITALAEDNHGQVWVGTEAGLRLMRDGHAAPLGAAKPFDGKTITSVYRNQQGVMWVAVKGAGIFRFLEGGFVQMTDGSVEELLQDAHCVIEDRQGRIWVGGGDDFVLCREGGEWRRYRTPRHLSRPYVVALAEDSEGTVWAGSISEGVFEFKAGKLTAIDAGNGLLDNFVEALLVDREGNLWVGTGSGLSCLSRSRLAVFGQDDGLGYGAVHGLAEIMPGRVWACKPGSGLYEWRGREFHRMATSDPLLRSANLNSILVTRDGSCWISSTRGILRCKSPLAPDIQVEPLALAGKDVASLTEDRQGHLWAGTRSGELWRLSGTNWQHLTQLQPAHAISAMVEDKEGGLWAATEGSGIFRWRDGVKDQFHKRNGLLSDTIRTLHLDSAGVLWIGTDGGGLARMLGGRINNFTTREGMADNSINQILEDEKGMLWLGSRRGIAGVSKQDLANLAEGTISTVYPQIFGRTEGMLTEECAGGFFPSGLRAKSGLFWFPTLKGVVVVNPRIHQSVAPPVVMIEEIVVDETSMNFRQLAPEAGDLPEKAGSPVQIAPGKKRLEFHFTGLSFTAPERLRFRYRLEGLDPDWVEAGTRRTAFYGYLSPGNYRFRVTACNSAGVWNETGAAVSLTVIPEFYQTFWFVGLTSLGCVVSLGAMIRLGVKRKLQRRLKLLEQERAVERERTRIAQDLHDELGSSLTRLSLMSDLLKEQKDNPAQVVTSATTISQTSIQSVRALEEIVWALRPGSDSVQSLIEYIAHFAKELFEGNTTQCRLDLPDELPNHSLPPEMRHNVFLIIKEALTNVFKHAHAREVLVQARVAPGGLQLVVADDGAGCQLPSPPGVGTRNGLGNMQRRAEAMGGALQIVSVPGQGTRVTVDICLPSVAMNQLRANHDLSRTTR